MRLTDYASIASRQLKKHKMRTILTVLGIMIGVASMITVMSVGDGGQKMINEELLKFGINRVWFFPSDVRGPNDMLVLSDAQMLGDIVGAKEVAPSAYEKVYLRTDKKTMMADLVGTNDALFSMEQMTYSEGRGLIKSDIDYYRKVVVLSEEAKEELFGESDALGEKISINGQRFTVVGVEKEDQSIYSSFFSGKCYIPVSTFTSMFSTKYVDENLSYCNINRGA